MYAVQQKEHQNKAATSELYTQNKDQHVGLRNQV